MYGYSSCNYSLNVTEVYKNNSRCGEHGTPNSDGTCVCRDYYAGALCDIRACPTQMQRVSCAACGLVCAMVYWLTRDGAQPRRSWDAVWP